MDKPTLSEVITGMIDELVDGMQEKNGKKLSTHEVYSISINNQMVILVALRFLINKG